MRKFKMATILLYGKNKFSYIHPQMSSNKLNLPTVHSHPSDALHEKITENNSSELNVNIFHKRSFT